ncbi:MAG: hypothetical protein ACJAS3_001511 [Roseivirga sp.]|jgi:hypothetical protein
MKTTTLFSTIIFSMLFFACSGEKKEGGNNEESQMPAVEAKEVTKPKSPPESTKVTIGGTDVLIDYHSPGVRGRTVFGGLVAYDQVWVTGAHSATSIEFSRDVELNGNKVSKGKYALFTIPGKSEWTLIINTDYNQHLADNYDQSKDILRLQLMPEKLETVQEHLLYEVTPTEKNEGEISISWADIKLSFKMRAS